MGVLYRISVRANNRAGESIDQWEELKIPVERKHVLFNMLSKKK
jgi:hypothetical protein